MSESAEALTFGPQWIRDLSNGTNIPAPPPPASPGPIFKLAQFRYGKEEMLALFSDNLKPPDLGEVSEYILTKDISLPLVCIPMSEEEQRNSFGSLNSAAVLKMMGRGGQRGERGGRGGTSSRGGRGAGHGRGEGGFHRAFSVDESFQKSEEAWQRDAASKRLSWGENNGRGSREQETSPRTFELSAPPVRHKEPSRALSSGNWRSAVAAAAEDDDDDGGGWTVSGPRGSERSEKWRGSSRGGWHSQGSREEYTRGDQGGGERRRSDSWNRSSHDRNSFDDLPEWSKSDNVFEPDLGSFDSSGAFCVTKEKKELNDTGQKELSNEKEVKEDWDKELNEEGHGTSESINNKDDLHSDEKERTEEEDVAKKKEKQEENITDVKPQTNQKEVPPCKEDKSKIAADKEEKTSHLKSIKVSGSGKGDAIDESSPVRTPHDEIGAHLERVAESCIANLVVEGEELTEREVHGTSRETPSPVDVTRASPTEDQTKWLYRDPQGLEQGPFRNEEMVEWFHHGYFTMQLSIRRQCDAVYLPLGEVIKRWGRVPFLPGPGPPPISHQQLMNQQQSMFMQQQLLQQHYQQLQKQAILQQIQNTQVSGYPLNSPCSYQQQQQQQQKDQQRRHPDLHLIVDNSAVDESARPRVVSPRSLPVGGASEAIWGPEPESPKSAWSPGTSSASVWEHTNKQKSPVPSAEVTKKLEEEKAKAETEKRESELMALKRKEEEKREMLKKHEEQRLQREALQRENELKLQKQNEEEEENIRREKERKRQEVQRQAEAEKRKEMAAKQKKEAVQQEQKQRKEYEEQKQGEIREQQKQALMRLHQQQQELQRRQDQQREEQKIKEQLKEQERKEKLRQQQRQEEQNMQQLRQHLEQKRMQSSTSSRWGSQNAATLSLSEIQEQEEKNRRANDEKMRELEARQLQLQQSAQAAGSHGWADKQPGPTAVKSLKTIQDEQERQVGPRHSKQTSRPAQPAQAALSGAWANNWKAGNNNVWSGTDVNADEDAVDETGFWAEAVRATSNTSQPQAQRTNANQTRVSAAPPAVAIGKKGKKENKEEASVRKIFQQPANDYPLIEWYTPYLAGISTSVDIPTFIAFLEDIESPYEIHNYVRDFLGDSKPAQLFAKEFIERKQSKRPAAIPAPTPAVPKSTWSNDVVVSRGCGGGNRPLPSNDPENKDTAGGNGKNKKKKKQRMQKVDPSILGFSVNAAAERVNMGEIQSVDDS